jgi:hypothetical protein
VNNTNPALDKALENLADITLGESPSVWPLAWGWWVLIVLILAVITTLVILIISYRKKRKIKRKALTAIRQLNESEPQALRNLHAILRSAAIHYYPRHDISELHGDAWQHFLVSQASGQKRITKDVTEGLINLEQSLYTKSTSISMTQAKQSVSVWIQCCLPPSNSDRLDIKVNDTRHVSSEKQSQGVEHV